MSRCRDEDGRFASCDTGGRRSRKRGRGRRAGTSKYTSTSVEMINTPRMYRYLSRITSRELEKDARDAAAKMYMLAGLFPGLPAVALQDLATGKAEVIIDEKKETVTVIYDDPRK